MPAAPNHSSAKTPTRDQPARGEVAAGQKPKRENTNPLWQTLAMNSASLHVSRVAPTLQRVIEIRPPGRREASAFGRAQELLDRMNRVSRATHFRLDGQVLQFDEVAGGVMTNFETQVRDIMGLAAVIPLRLITSAGRSRVGGVFRPVWVDVYEAGYVDLDDLLASDDLSFQMNLLHLLRERARVTNYARRIGSRGLRTDDGAGNLTPEFRRAHQRGLVAEAEFLQDALGDPTIRFLEERAGARGADQFVFRSAERYHVIHEFRGNVTTTEVRGGSVFIITAAGVRQSVQDFLDARAAAAAAPAAAGAAPAAAPPAAPAPAPAPPAP